MFKQLPKWSFPAPDENYALIDRQTLKEVLQEHKHDEKAIQRIMDDLDFLEKELVRLFRMRSYNAAKNKNRHLLYGQLPMVFAIFTAIVGALVILSSIHVPILVPLIAFLGTFSALFITYITTISGRAAVLSGWMENRRHAEYLRREFFAFLMDLPPYDTLSGFQRKQQLSIRAANINRGIYPDSSADG